MEQNVKRIKTRKRLRIKYLISCFPAVTYHSSSAVITSVPKSGIESLWILSQIYFMYNVANSYALSKNLRSLSLKESTYCSLRKQKALSKEVHL